MTSSLKHTMSIADHKSTGTTELTRYINSSVGDNQLHPKAWLFIILNACDHAMS